MRKALILFLAICSIVSTSFGQSTITVVIDPGHGGHDVGHEAQFGGHEDEKKLNLKIAQFLGGYIEKYLQNVKVVYTRTGDTYPDLDARVNKANHIGADYFISIHCNGNDRKSVRGTESHVHSLELQKSVRLAQEIERQFSARAGRKSRGIKDKRDLQHSLQVLKYTNMPSVLVECGFVTNQREANFLNTTYGQEIIASAIFRGFRETIVKAHPNISFIRNTPQTTTNSTLASSGSYGIQIASSKDPIDTNDGGFKRAKMPVSRRKLNTTSAYKYIYVVGDYASKKEAKNDLANLQSRGFKDAIIIKLN